MKCIQSHPYKMIVVTIEMQHQSKWRATLSKLSLTLIYRYLHADSSKYLHLNNTYIKILQLRVPICAIVHVFFSRLEVLLFIYLFFLILHKKISMASYLAVGSPRRKKSNKKKTITIAHTLIRLRVLSISTY